MIWAKKKKSPHFREKYLVLSYLNSNSYPIPAAVALSGLFSLFWQDANDLTKENKRPKKKPLDRNFDQRYWCIGEISPISQL